MTKIDGKRQKMYGKMREPSSPIKIEESFPADLSSKRSLFSYFHKQPKLLYEPFELSMADENNACLSAYEPRSSSPRTTEPPMLQQLYLDLGQKNFGMTTCSECHMVYNPSFKEDVRLHQKYHGQHGHGLLFDASHCLFLLVFLFLMVIKVEPFYCLFVLILIIVIVIAIVCRSRFFLQHGRLWGLKMNAFIVCM